MPGKPVIRRALISVSDKTGLTDLATALHQLGIDLIATGGTAKLLQQHHIPITEVSDVTGFPEIMNGRVKTLHPHIHAGILARRGVDEETLAQHHITPIDLIIVNLYPFQQTIAKADCTFEQAIEQIDIGGPTMLRAAAKNHAHVTVVVDPNDYPTLLESMKTHGNTSLAQRKQLAAKVFQHTAHYDQAISAYFAKQINQQNEACPDQLQLDYQQSQSLRYGENPQQAAASYIDPKQNGNTLLNATQHQGKPLSYNNMVDSDAALAIATGMGDTTTCAIIKHATPCGIGQAEQLEDAYLKALACDPVSAFGGIIAFNKKVDTKTAERILEKQFAEVIIAPSFEADAFAIFQRKKNLRILSVGESIMQPAWQLRSISGGLLMQETDACQIQLNDLQCVTTNQPTEQQRQDCLFAWRAVRFVKSNAIVYAKDGATLGIGTGQTSRVFSAEIAIQKAQQAGLSIDHAVMASDAFFPFADGIEVAIQAGIKAIIQPGGSLRDDDVIEAANKAGIVMLFTGTRHFLH